ncbi:hypothetical protein PI125_g17253 [Phytophthora idaei]|nr:hypothetical protein PI125_g17253 [Phytophthora idaei]KAG3139805.1 hypothetical protein PI126_g16305 [Phytophthora idaei]
MSSSEVPSSWVTAHYKVSHWAATSFGFGPQSCTIRQGSLYTFGDLEELYEFKIARRSWSVVPIHGEAPLRRKDYSGVLYRDNFYVFGGIRVPGYGLQNDIVKYNFSKRSSLICDV